MVGQANSYGGVYEKKNFFFNFISKNKMYAQNLNKNAIFIDVMLILCPLLAYESYHKNSVFCDNFCKLITEKVLTLRQKNHVFI